MLQLNLAAKAHKFLQKLPPKHERQVVGKIISLTENPLQPDTKQLVGYAPLRRADIGEYRIIYHFDAKTLFVVLVGKRNDSEVYKKPRRAL